MQLYYVKVQFTLKISNHPNAPVVSPQMKKPNKTPETARLHFFFDEQV